MPDYSENQSAGNATILIGSNEQVNFYKNSTASTANISVAPAGRLYFRDDSTAQQAKVTLQASGGGNPAYMTFTERASAGQAAFDVGSRASIDFLGQSTGASASASVKGAINFGGTSSAGAMHFTIESIGSLSGQVSVYGDATAGSAIIDNRGGYVIVGGNASAATAMIHNLAAQSHITSWTQFLDDSDAGSATIDNDAGTRLTFNINASAGSARITNRGTVEILAQASGGKSTLINKGIVTVANTATADQASITNEAGGRIEFRDTSTAGSATIATKAGATTAFLGKSSGGTARLSVEAGGVVDFSGRDMNFPTGTIMSAGMILGAGTFYLGNNILTVGVSNNSFQVKSLIADFSTPQSGARGGSLAKAGTGTMVLSNTNTYSGGTFLQGGTLVAAEKGALGTGGIYFQKGAQTLVIEKKALIDSDGTLAFKRGLEDFGVGDQLQLVGAGPVTRTIQYHHYDYLHFLGLDLNSGSIIAFIDTRELAGSSGLLGVFQTTSGDVRVAFNTRETATGTAGDDTIYVIDGPGGTAKGGAGRDLLVGDTGNDTLDGGAGADTMRGEQGGDRYIVDEAGDVVEETGTYGTDTVAASITYTLADTIENLELTGKAAINGTGNAGQNTILGNGAANILRGGDGDDVLEGGGGDDTLYGSFERDASSGRDTLRGGAGDDVMFGGGGIDSFDGGEGYDTVIMGFAVEGEDTPVTIDLADPGKNAGKAAGERYVGVEKFQLGNAGDTFWADPLSSLGLWIQGYGGSDRITTASGDDRLDGGAGADWLEGGAGDDTYDVNDAADVVVEGRDGGFDTIFASVSYTLTGDTIEELWLTGSGNIDATGAVGNDVLSGNLGNNVLDGRQGADFLLGRLGDDTYIVDNADDLVLEESGEGTDTVVASVGYALAAGSAIERLQLAASTSTAGLTLIGNEFAQTITGNGGANVLDGKGGADTLIGGAGSDTYTVDNSRDQVIEAVGGGRDTVGALISYKLAAGQEIETLRLTLATGKQNLNLTGNEFGQALIGNDGNNTLDGRGGADVMTGARGNDTYSVDSSNDRVVEGVGGGIDRVVSLSHYKLAAGQEIETLQLAASTGTGKFNLIGNEFGQALIGNAGANGLEGKGGNDVLTGGRGADAFIFGSTIGANNIDRITDFSIEDTIRLSKSIFAALASGELKAGEFKDIAEAKVDADDHILYDSRTGDVFYDADGSGKAAAVKFAVLDNKAALTHADFLIA